MNRTIQYVNLCGVALLTLLCAFQWKTNRQLQTESVAFAKDRIEMAGKLASAEKASLGSAADLEQFRAQLSQTALARDEAEAKLKKAQHALDQLTNELGQLRDNLTHWTAAVTLRDEQLNLASAQIKNLNSERNESTEKFNDLAQKYNTLVNNFEDRSKQFNELVGKYNALLEPPPKSSKEP